MAIKEFGFGYELRNWENEGRQLQEQTAPQRNRSWAQRLRLHIQCGSTLTAKAFSMFVPLPLEQPQSRVNMENSSRKI